MGAGIEAWFDETDLTGGQEWDLEIRQQLKRSDLVLVFLSEEAITKRGYLHKEIRHAIDIADHYPEGVAFVIPVRLENCTLPDRLSKLHAVDLFTPTGPERLLASISHHCAKLANIQPLIELTLPRQYSASSTFSTQKNIGAGCRMISISADGRFIASAYGKREWASSVIRLDDGRIVSNVKHIDGDGNVHGIALSSAGDLLLTMGRVRWSIPSVVLLWDLPSGKRRDYHLKTGPSWRAFASLSASRELDKFLTTDRTGRVMLWDTETLVGTDITHDANHARISASGNRIAYLTCSGERWKCHVVDTESRSIVTEILLANYAMLAIDADGSQLAAARDDVIEIYSISNPSKLIRRICNTTGITEIVFGADDGGSIVSGHKSDGRVNIWAIESGRLAAQLHGLRGRICSLSTALDGRTVGAINSKGRIAVWHI